MSWNVSATGTADEIGKAFDAERDRAAADGMIESEQHDIDEARDFAMQITSANGGYCAVSANGHWTVADEKRDFGSVSVTITKATPPTKTRSVRH